MTDTQKPEALRLADVLETNIWAGKCGAAEREQAAACLRRLHAENEALRYERDHARAHQMAAGAVLTGIYNLMYPPVFTTPDGIKMAFRPKALDPHEILQELSDRIRAVPDQIAAMKGQP